MIANARNLLIKLVRGRTQTMIARIGTFSITSPPATGGPQIFNFFPSDISLWWFSFTMRANFTRLAPVSLTYNPIQNKADPLLGQLMWDILDSDTELLLTGNYVFDVSVTLSDLEPRFFAGGIASLSDNVTDPVVLPVTV
jgi:hypothetical protein